jgi:two-component system phosphate regulon sensor histidine kinase PhoR
MADESEWLAQIESLKTQLATAQAEQWKLIRSVCHELRLPLSAIKGYNDLLLLMGTVNDQQKDFVTRIKNNVIRMSGMIANLHDLAYMGEGTFTLKLSALPTASTIEKVCEVMQPVADEHGNTLNCAVPDTLPAIRADQERAEQSLRILIENACWYTPPGGQITVAASPSDDGSVKISVTDTGIGVPETERGSLFSLFFRGDTPIVREQSGAGMNLYMLRHFIELMGGSCGANFPAEGGSCFWVCLPMATDH